MHGAFVLKFMISRLYLSQFRNFKTLEMRDLPSSVILCGPNGSGKTNILEAVSHVCAGRGLRGTPPREQLSHNAMEQRWCISGEVDTHHLKVLFDPVQKEKRQYFVDHTSLSSSTAFGEYLNVVWYTPTYDAFFVQSSQDRRRFIDKLAYTFIHTHAQNLNRYEHLQRERMRLIQSHASSSWLDATEETMAQEALHIITSRQELVLRLNAAQEHLHDTFPRFHATMNLTPIDLSIILEKLKENRCIDKEAHKTHYGPHRSDLELTQMYKNMPAYLCSTGEQKMLFLALLLAYVHARLQFNATPLVLLLDEVVSHLDVHHRGVLFSEISSLQQRYMQPNSLPVLQAWMSGTDEVLFEPAMNAAFFSITHGSLEKL